MEGKVGATAADDFARQPTLPRRQSTRTPALAYRDASAGGELWIGSGKAVLRAGVSAAGLGATHELSAVRAGAAITAARDDVIVAESPWQAAGTNRVYRIVAASGAVEPIPSAVTAPVCLAVSSSNLIEGTFLFVGGGALPGQYPMSSPSEILRFDGHEFRSVLVTNLGMVTAAKFGAIPTEGAPSLILASEWGSPRILRGGEGGWEDWNPVVELSGAPPVRLHEMTGWWQSLASTDVDGDGRLDVVLGNWGLNSAYSLYAGWPAKSATELRLLEIHYGAMGDGGPFACVEAYTGADGKVRPIHGLADLSAHLPWLATRFETHRAFAEATLGLVLNKELTSPSRLECRWLSSVLLLNRGERFELRFLPDAAQLGPIMDLAVADFDGDGHPDLYGAQGFFGHNFGVGRDDGGEGVFLLGRGQGEFEPVSASETGVRILGEQRAAVVVDADRDGRPDLIIGEHGGSVSLLINRRARP
jgi:hypothetical protein